MSHITIKGEIGMDKTASLNGKKCSVADLIQEVRNMEDTEPIDLEIDSLGGSLLHGIELYRALKNHSGKVTALVDGCACSAASLIMCGADHISVRPDSVIMIHGVQVEQQVINSQNLAKLSEDIESLDSVIAEIYAQRTGVDTEQIRDWMNPEKWMSGKEAIHLGFADALAGETETNPSLENAFKNYKAIAKPLTKTEMEELMGDVKTAAQKLLNACDPEKKNEEIENACGDDKKAETPNPEEEKAELKNEDSTTDENTPADSDPDDNEPDDTPDTSDDKNDSDDPDEPEDDPEDKDKMANAVAEAVAAERKRLMEIDAIAGVVDSKLLNEAKYGRNPMSAQELAFEVLKQSKAQGKDFLNAWKSDVAESGTDKVETVPADVTKGKNNKVDGSALKAAAHRVNETKGA